MEKPILFSTPMVQAILAGQKTMTRRVVKPQPKDQPMFCFAGSHKWMHNRWYDKEGDTWFTPPCNTDDILWVRETFFQASYSTLEVWGEYENHYAYVFEYLADGKDEKSHWRDERQSYWMAKRPAIHMPRKAARLFLKVTNVRVERLQDITEVDAISEGALRIPNTPEYQKAFDEAVSRGKRPPLGESPRQRFHRLWDNLNTKRGYGWDTNPWVWVVEFERVQP